MITNCLQCSEQRITLQKCRPKQASRGVEPRASRLLNGIMTGSHEGLPKSKKRAKKKKRMTKRLSRKMKNKRNDLPPICKSFNYSDFRETKFSSWNSWAEEGYSATLRLNWPPIKKFNNARPHCVLMQDSYRLRIEWNHFTNKIADRKLLKPYHKEASFLHRWWSLKLLSVQPVIVYGHTPSRVSRISRVFRVVQLWSEVTR